MDPLQPYSPVPTPEEHTVLATLDRLSQDVKRLPQEHATEQHELATHIHRLQDLVAARCVWRYRRMYKEMGPGSAA